MLQSLEIHHSHAITWANDDQFTDAYMPQQASLC